jgi:hypothetical protein
MDALTHCRAMESFCRQRARMEGEVAGFWLAEADMWRSQFLALAGKENPVAKRRTVPTAKSTPALDLKLGPR